MGDAMRTPAPARELAALGRDGRQAAMLDKHRRRTDVTKRLS
jgi:hypothetical protein